MYYLSGKVLSRKDSTIILEVNGVGYALNASKSAVANATGQTAKIFVVQVLYRSPEPAYYGFGNETERELFSLLINEALLPTNEAFKLVSRAGSDLYTAMLNKDWDQIAKWLQSTKLNAADIVGKLIYRLKDVPEVKVTPSPVADGFDILDADGESLIERAIPVFLALWAEPMKPEKVRSYLVQAAKNKKATPETSIQDISKEAYKLANDDKKTHGG